MSAIPFLASATALHAFEIGLVTCDFTNGLRMYSSVRHGAGEDFLYKLSVARYASSLPAIGGHCVRGGHTNRATPRWLEWIRPTISWIANVILWSFVRLALSTCLRRLRSLPDGSRKAAMGVGNYSDLSEYNMQLLASSKRKHYHKDHTEVFMWWYELWRNAVGYKH